MRPGIDDGARALLLTAFVIIHRLIRLTNQVVDTQIAVVSNPNSANTQR